MVLPMATCLGPEGGLAHGPQAAQHHPGLPRSPDRAKQQLRPECRWEQEKKGRETGGQEVASGARCPAGHLHRML